MALTGESLPRDVEKGDDVASGCINLSGVLRIRTTKTFGESTVSKIIRLVENADSRKSRSESFITRFARIYTPIVVSAALLLAFVPPLLSGNGFSGFSSSFATWLHRALIFLVVSCPCALVTASPSPSSAVWAAPPAEASSSRAAASWTPWQMSEPWYSTRPAL